MEEKLCEKLCWKIGWNCLVGKLGEGSGWDKVEKFIGKIWWESYVEQFYGIIELTIVCKKIMTNLLEKINVIFLGTIRRTSLV